VSERIGHRTTTVNDRKIFYREAGKPTAPTLLLLHGLPTSSQMNRDLMPALADRFHLMAPDYIVIQNANAYIEGVGEGPKKVLLPLWENRNPTTEKPARKFVSLEATKYHWLVGAKEPEAINPDNWVFDQTLLDRPGTQDYQVDLLENLKTNIALYPEWQAAFRKHAPKTLIIWGKYDPFFIPPGARTYQKDLPEAKLVWLDSGHFVLDENFQQVAAEIRSVFG
jgi:pimeloyl-ACP methyl ester carboxylesterase